MDGGVLDGLMDQGGLQQQLQDQTADPASAAALERYTESPFSAPVPEVDVFLGVVCVLTLVIGVPSNLFSVMYFVQKRRGPTRGTKAFFECLYIAISGTDFIICLTTLPVAEAFLNGRSSALFQNAAFCSAWGLLWEVIPFFSVFLVGVLSISRLITLFKPHKVLSTAVLKSWLLTYLAGLVISKGLPLILGISEVKFFRNTMYCFFLPNRDGYWFFSIVSSTTLLAVPVIPILVTCVAMVYKLSFTRAPVTVSRLKSSKLKQVEATKTIIVVTSVYIFYNIPVFIKFVHHLCYVAERARDPEYGYKEAYNTVLLYWYGWVLTYIICVVLNSATNPIVYLLRMSGFQNFAMDVLFMRFSKIKRGGSFKQDHGSFKSDRLNVHSLALSPRNVRGV